MKKKLKSCMSILLCFILLCSTSSLAYAIEETGGNDEVSVVSQDEDFVIKYGILKKYVGNDTIVVIPEGVTGIDQQAFYECDMIEEIVIPKGVTIIESGTFANLANLKKVTIPEGVTTIGNYAFRESGVTEIVLPKTLQTIGEHAFESCYSLTEITIPEGVTSIGFAAFRYSGLQQVELASTIISLDEKAFERTPWLEEEMQKNQLVINNGILVWADEEISGRLVVPEGVTCIGGSAFYRNRNLTEVIIPEGVTSVGGLAFYWCNNLKEISIPKSLIHFGDSAFGATPWVADQLEQNPFLVINGVLVDVASSIAGDVKIPTSVTVIGNGAFRSCTNIINVYIPETVTRIEEFAFINCTNLENVYIPNSVKEIVGDYVFAVEGGTGTPDFDIENLVIHAETGSVGQQYIYCAIDKDVFSYVPTNKDGNYNPYVVIDSSHIGDSEYISSNHMQEIANINKTYPVEIKNNDITVSIPVNGIVNIEKYRFSHSLMFHIAQVDLLNLEIDENEFVALLEWETFHEKELPGEVEICIQLGTEWIGKTIYYYELDWYDNWIYDYAGKLLVDDEGVITITNDIFGQYIFTTERPEVIKNDETGISDKNLYDAILEAADTNGDGFLEKSEAEELDYFFAEDKNIVSLEGIQYCKSLKQITLLKSEISDISRLAELSELNTVIVIDSKVTDISALTELSKLELLAIGNNQISDISALANNVNLTVLYAENNQISDISALAKLTQLIDLNVSGNQISDISVLENLTNITHLNVSNNLITDISVLEKLPNLQSVNTENNPIGSGDKEPDNPNEDENNPEDNPIEEEKIIDISQNPVMDMKEFENIVSANKQQDIVLTYNDVSITFKKGTMAMIEDLEEYDFTVTLESDYADSKVPAVLTKNNFVSKVTYNYSGKLPGTAIIQLPVGSEYAGKTLYYTLLNEDGTFGKSQEVIADNAGVITIEQNHCSSYVVSLIDLENLTEDTENTQKPEIDQIPDDNENPETDQTPEDNEKPEMDQKPEDNEKPGTETIPETSDQTLIVRWIVLILLGSICCMLSKNKKFYS